MKISERLIDYDEGKTVIETVRDPNPGLHNARMLRDRGQKFGESEIIASVPMWLVTEWLKEAGVSWDDPASDDVINRKLASGDVAAFRTNPGRRL